MNRVVSAGFSALIIAACGGSAGNGAGGGAPVACPTVDYCALRCSGQETPLYPPSCEVPTCPCVPVTPRSDWVGTYHVADQPEAANLVLEPDGTFRWTIDGCGTETGDCGEWRKTQPHTIVLLPSNRSFHWSEGGAVSEQTKLDVVGDPDGDLVVTIPSPGFKPTAQRWKRGRVCASCVGGSATHEACRAPVPARCQ